MIKRITIAFVLTLVLILAMAGPALADEGGTPNENSSWGQEVSADAKAGDHGFNASGKIDGTPGHAGVDPPPWGQGGIRENFSSGGGGHG